MGTTELCFDLWALEAESKGAFTGYTVAMVTYC